MSFEAKTTTIEFEVAADVPFQHHGTLMTPDEEGKMVLPTLGQTNKLCAVYHRAEGGYRSDFMVGPNLYCIASEDVVKGEMLSATATGRVQVDENGSLMALESRPSGQLILVHEKLATPAEAPVEP